MTKKTLFITYAWEDNEEGDFDFVVQLLGQGGLDVRFDRIQLTAGKLLWEEIGETIASSDIDGWAYLVTPQSLQSKKCREEYFLALGRALDTKGDDFPLIALVHGADFKDLPPSLKIRLGVSLTDPHWVERVVASVERRAVVLPSSELQPIKVTWWNGREPGQRALEITPRLSTIGNWRIGIPLSHKDSLAGFSEGPSGALPMGASLFMPIDAENEGYRVVGAQGPIGAGKSAYAVFRESLPLPPHILIGGQGVPEYRLSLS